jgi:hypothetical protein
MSQDIPQEILARVDLLTAKLGVASEHIWTIWTSVAWTYSFTTLVFLILLLVTMIIFYKNIKIVIVPDATDVDSQAVISLVSGIIAIMLLFIVLVRFPDSVRYLANPESYALDQLACLIHSCQ